MSNRIRQLINLLVKAVKSIRIPKYNSKFSKKVFNNHKLLVLLVLRQYISKPYRDFIEWLAFSRIKEILFLRRIPHFTTLHKFSMRAKFEWLSKLIAKTVEKIKLKIAGIDSTDSSIIQKSFYYCKRIGSDFVKGFIKLSIISDMNKQLIAAVKIRKKSRHDSVDFGTLVKQANCKTVVADKGYDSEKNHLIAEKIGARLIAPLKNCSVPIGRTYGLHRKALKGAFPEEVYHQRNKCETVFSVMKRKFGSFLLTRKFMTQKAKLLCRAVAYNLHRITTVFYWFFIGFLQSHSHYKLFKD